MKYFQSAAFRCRLGVWLLLTALLPARQVITVGGMFEPRSLDPAQIWDDVSSFYVFNMYETLVRLNPRTLAIEPALALSWQNRDNNLVWTFRLRKGVRFHDGTRFDADAVVYSFQRQLDRVRDDSSPFPMFREIFSYLQEVKKIDSQTVSFRLSQPFSPFLATLSVNCAAIVSPALAGKAADWISSHSAGTGPYQLKSWQPGKQLVLEANRQYWGKPPAINEYVMVAERNIDTLTGLFLARKIDLLFAYSISKLEGMKRLNWVKISLGPVFSMRFLAINLRRPPLDSKAVRKTLRYLWDPRILKLEYQEYVLPNDSLLPRGFTSHPAGDEYPFSVEKARRILRANGQAKGFALRVMLDEADTLLFKSLLFYQKSLLKAGIRLTIDRIKTQDEYSQRAGRGDFDLAASGWILDYPDLDSLFYALFSVALQKQGFPNLSTAPEGRSGITALIEEGRREFDPARREQIYLRLNRLTNDEALAIPLYQYQQVIIHNQQLGPMEVDPLGRVNLYSLRVR